MILPLQAAIKARIVEAVLRLYNLDEAAVPAVAVEYPPNRQLGDLSVPIAFELARRLRKAPRAIAQEIAAALPPIDAVAQSQVAGNGYLNFGLDRAALLKRWLHPDKAAPVAQADKTIVEHTAINPNKAAHIGHLRNAALGDTLVRVLRFEGIPVEVQNYIDDTGVQVADVVVGFQRLEELSLDQVRALAAEPRFDYYCWDLYARVTEWYGGSKDRLAFRAAALSDIEHGHTAAADLAALIADRIVRRHLQTMARLNVGYDLLTWEGDILRLQFWARAFEILKDKGAVYLQNEGRLAGCWVMRIEDDSAPAQPPEDDESAGDGEESREKVIVRSNGTVTYVGKDIAYQFWKFGLLGRDFHYRAFETATRPTLWATTGAATAEEREAPTFGGASTTYNVIDVRQSYLQKLLKQALATLGYASQAERSIHFSYEMVALSHATARALGYEVSAEDAKKPFVEVSGRKGQGVKADDLLDRMIATAADEVARRNPEFHQAETARIASMIGVAAVRYFMVKYSRTKIIAFDIDEALSFEGESGPYLQYAVVRANNIFQKLRDREGLDEQGILDALGTLATTELATQGDELWGLVLEAARLDEVVEQVIRSLEFSVLAEYAFGLAQSFNAFYHRFSILNEERTEARYWRAGAVIFFKRQMTRALDLMGIQVPPRM